MPATTATQRLGKFIARTGNEDLAPDLAGKAAMCVLDAIGLALLAKNDEPAVAARSLAVEAAGRSGAATLWVDGKLVSASDAAFINGVAAHARLQDDTDHDSWAHPGSLVVPSVLACAETLDLGLPQTLRAIATGYATIQWLAVGEEVSRRLIARGLRTSATLGSMGAAAGCATALQLDARQAQSAVGIAASTTGGTLEPIRCGSDEWRAQNGRAAQGGYMAAMLARQGFFGAPHALEGPKGFLQAYPAMDAPPAGWASDPDLASLRKIMAKPFATAGDNMASACAAQMAYRKGIDPRRVREVEVSQWRPYTEYPGTSFKGPYTTPVQAQVSSCFSVCAMLVFGDLSYETVRSERSNDLVNALVGKTRITPHDGTHLQSKVSVTMDDGEVIVGDSEDADPKLIFQDAARAISVFEARLVGAGRAAGQGDRMASKVLAAARSGESISIRAILAELAS